MVVCAALHIRLHRLSNAFRFADIAKDFPHFRRLLPDGRSEFVGRISHRSAMGHGWCFRRANWYTGTVVAGLPVFFNEKRKGWARAIGWRIAMGIDS